MTHGTYYDMPSGMYPVHMFHPKFETLGLWFPALDAWVLEMLCRKTRERVGRKLEVLEIGTFVGGSLSIFAPHATLLVCADTWSGSGKDKDEMKPLYAENDVWATFQKNETEIVLANPDCGILPFKRTTPDNLPSFLRMKPGGKFDLIFIDGAHDYESVTADIALAKKWIAPGGIICGHDFQEFDGVSKAAMDLYDIEACGTVWWKEMK